MKTNQIVMLAVGAIALVSAGYWLRPGGQPPKPAAAGVAAPKPMNPKPLYYQDPDGKPIYSATPKKTSDGRPFKPVYAEEQATKTANTPKLKGKGKILYYRNPMGLADTSQVPKKDAMGMDYIPVYEGEDESGVVTVSPARMQMLGVKTAPVETRKTLMRTVRATGTIAVDESRLAIVSTKFDVVVEKLFVSTTGAHVHAGQPLARVWIDTPDTMMQRGPDVITREIDYVLALQEKNPVRIAQAADVLRQYGIPESTLAEIRKTGHATREIILTAPRSGVILEKQAIEGMRINTGDPLFKIGDLSSVWLIADVQEQDLGDVEVGAPVHASFVAFPGQVFTGKVDFIYPTLTAGTRKGRVRIVLPNRDGRLRESMYATVAIEVPAAAGKEMLAVPDSAVIDSGTQQVVLVAKGGGRFEPRTVRIGAQGDGYTQILSGIKAGEKVVVGANFLIDAESNLRAALASFNGGKQ